jgi:hypothetical protein
MNKERKQNYVIPIFFQACSAIRNTFAAGGGVNNLFHDPIHRLPLWSSVQSS